MPNFPWSSLKNLEHLHLETPFDPEQWPGFGAAMAQLPSLTSLDVSFYRNEFRRAFLAALATAACSRLVKVRLDNFVTPAALGLLITAPQLRHLAIRSVLQEQEQGEGELQLQVRDVLLKLEIEDDI